jgi:hypothetical protein
MSALYHGRGNRGPVTPEELILAARRQRQSLVDLFDRATVHVERSEDGRSVRRHARPDGTVWVHAYSTRDRVPGPEYADLDIVAMTGGQLRGQIPAGVGIALDHGLDSAARILEADPGTQPIAVVPDQDVR